MVAVSCIVLAKRAVDVGSINAIVDTESTVAHETIIEMVVAGGTAAIFTGGNMVAAMIGVVDHALG